MPSRSVPLLSVRCTAFLSIPRTLLHNLPPSGLAGGFHWEVHMNDKHRTGFDLISTVPHACHATLLKYASSASGMFHGGRMDFRWCQWGSMRCPLNSFCLSGTRTTRLASSRCPQGRIGIFGRRGGTGEKGAFVVYEPRYETGGS